MPELEAAGLGLTSEELERIAAALGREPTVVELHAFDAQWSEHCSYKSSRRFLRELPTAGPGVFLGPGEDAGAIRLGEHKGERYAIVVAHESHNHPSQVVPFEGAATGVGGIVRDVLCMGAQVIGIADPLRFGTSQYARYVAQAVVDGIAGYGNAIGVPNVGGDVAFDPRFDDNVLVNVVALGVVKERDLIHSAAPPGSEGWDIVLVGKATDRSGFGGAAFSSLQLDAADAEANKGAVQVPDAFLKSVIMRASYALFDMMRREKIVAGFKDLGAGGVMGCTAEIVSAGGFGARIDLDKIPVTDPELHPAIIAVGETQERMCWVVPPAFTPKLIYCYNEEFGLTRVARGAAAVVIGKVTAEQRYVLSHRGETVMDVATDLLCGSIAYERPYDLPQPHRGPVTPLAADLRTLGPKVLAHLDVCSRARIYERFDGVVRGTTAIPRGYADAGVLVPVPGSPLAVAVGVAGNPRYGALDARAAAVAAVVEANRNVAAVGASPVALTDCLNFGDAGDPRQFGEFVAAVDGLAQAANALHTPFVSGNVSLHNTSANGNAIPASAIVACVGTIPDVSKAATSAFKASGHALYLLGRRQDALGGSVVAQLLEAEYQALPEIALDEVVAEIGLLLDAYDKLLVFAAHDVSDGGVFTTICEMAFGAREFGLGARIDSHERWGDGTGTAGAWFGESGGFVVEVEDAAAFEGLARKRGVTIRRLGEVTSTGKLDLGGTALGVEELFATWSSPLARFYDMPAAESESSL